MKLFTRASILIAVAGCLAAIANGFGPKRIPWAEDWEQRVEAKAAQEGMAVVTLTQTRQLIAAGSHTILDARPPADFVAGHLPSAVSLPPQAIHERFDEIQVWLKRDAPILVYCSGSTCDDSLRLARFLREQGYTRVSLFAEGFSSWRAAGMDVEVGS